MSGAAASRSTAFRLAAVAGLLAAAGPAAAAAGAPPGQAVPAGADTLPRADTLYFSVLLQGNPAGEEAVWRDAFGDLRSRYRYADRGRGPELETRIRPDSAGLPRWVTVDGLDYLKNPVRERFFRLGPVAGWRSRAESGLTELRRPAAYVPMNAAPSTLAVLARALLAAAGGPLPLLPAGSARLERITSRPLGGAGGAAGPDSVTLYAISGLDFTPTHVWLDGSRHFFAAGAGGGWLGVVRRGAEEALPELAAAEEAAERAWLAALADSLPVRPGGPLAIRGARLFDARTGEARAGMTVLVEGRRIAAVGPDARIELPEDARVVDAAGGTLLPGLFDMHVHLAPVDGILHLAAGVTTVRDLANDPDALLEARRRFERGTAIGPRVVMAGFLDGPGPFAGPTEALVDTEDEARDWIDRYAGLGYSQIKLYSSLDTALVPAIVEAAHERGLRVSGHIPVHMSAAEAVRLGFDEIQHANMLVLNFLPDTLDTRTPVRFTAVAEGAADLDLASDSVRAFIELLRERQVVVDPTLGVWEHMFTARPGEMSPQFEAVGDRLPPQVARGLRTGGLPVPDGRDERYRASFRRLLDLTAALHDAGVTIVPGTDAMAGFALHRELELYAEAGIPAAEVLRLATLGSARVAGVADSLGSIEPGKLADLVLVAGDPLSRMSDVRRTRLVVKGGVLHDPRELRRALGIGSGEPAEPDEPAQRAEPEGPDRSP